MLIDLHSHTSGISTCCWQDASFIVNETKKTGIDALVLTNHYQIDYVEGVDALAFAQKYVDEYYHTKQFGEKMGVKVFFGVELTVENCRRAHLLIYGVDTDFVLKFPDIYNYPQKDIYELVRKNDGLLIWAHPFRGGYNDTVDLKYIDGVEINCHPKYKSTYFYELLKIAVDNNLLLTCGGDYHADTPYRPKCGVYVPDSIRNSNELINYLKISECLRILKQEPFSDEITEFSFNKLI